MNMIPESEQHHAGWSRDHFSAVNGSYRRFALVFAGRVDYNGEKITKAGKYRLVLKASDELGNTNTEDIGFEIRN